MIEPPDRPRYLSAAEAAALLGVSRSSLYSYASRGRIHAEPDPRNPRLSRYLAIDIHRLRDRKEARLRPDIAARKTLAWGLPVLESHLTLIEGGRLYYRGHDALALARSGPFENVIRLLWADRATVTLPDVSLSAACRGALADLRSLEPTARMQAVLPIAAAEDSVPGDTSAAAVAAGWRIVNLLTAAATPRIAPAGSIASRLASGWSTRHGDARRLLDLALILCADHELNVSAFAVRVVASTGSSPYDAVAAGLGALRGSRHGGQTALVEQFLDQAGSPQAVGRIVAERRRAGAAVPGFGHPLYPDGDPRARVLLAAVQRACPRSDAAAWVPAARRAGRALLGAHPNIDFALVILRRALGLPRGSALVLFALGRSAGWIAHAMEQYASPSLIRPRATYTGPAPR